MENEKLCERSHLRKHFVAKEFGKLIGSYTIIEIRSYISNVSFVPIESVHNRSEPKFAFQ